MPPCPAQPPQAAPPAPRPFLRDIEALASGTARNTVRAAEAMPVEGYAYRPRPDAPSFGQLVVSAIEGQHAACDEANATPASSRAALSAADAGKETVVAALKGVTAECATAYRQMTEATAAELIVSGNTKRSRISVLVWNYAHEAQIYGTIAEYLAARGVKS